ncbi:winged helix-turn-helix transcriptional regulator [Natronomonas salina]|uniref:ArsR/SmtB family transcription factor n=1 Tax=Natronomonas salina TaxID=1710540 RepID=UPI0015B5B0E7|nr:winged helix-turn-helix domain-containing protein [Natronomonas salina]QLD88094.1 winged helix-turn-helix transcriptional regulator [Natronomonas salina]
MSENASDADSSGSGPARSDACCSADHGLTEEELANDVQLLTTLGNDTRYEALRLIAGADDEICVCELEPSLGVSQGAVSQALSRLFGAGLVERRKEGRWRYYSTTPRAERVLSVLDETRAMTDD